MSFQCCAVPARECGEYRYFRSARTSMINSTAPTVAQISWPTMLVVAIPNS